MRKKLVTIVAAGALGLTGLAVAVPALAAPSTADAAASPVERIKKALSVLVTDKTITQAQADKVATTLAASDIGRGGHGRGGPGGMHDLAAAATALTMTEAELRTALESGKSLAQVAKDKNVTTDALVAALATAAKEHIAQGVKDGKFTQAQADERLKDLTARITERVNSTRPAGMGRGPGGGGRRGE